MATASPDPKRVVLGTAGHVDHGKTALVRALTGVDTDRWEEEKRRGITLDLGFAPFPSPPDLAISVIDVPGHEDFVRNMLAGATGIDLVLLVVAADEGPMPQTREHLAIVSLLGIRAGVIAVTKADCVDEEWLALAVEAARDEVRAVAGADWPTVAVSARTGEGLQALREAILDAARAAPARPADDLFRLPVDRSFSLPGAGTVVTGTIWSGRVARDAECRVLPDDRRARVRGVHVHGREVAEARAGDRAALALVGVDRQAVGRGHTLVTDRGWEPATILEAEVTVLPYERRPLRSGQRVRVHLGTAEVMARAALLDARECPPGGSALAQLRLEAPLVARAGDRFILRFYSPVTTIGGGHVLRPRAHRRGRLPPGEAETLRRLVTGAPVERLDALLDLRRGGGVTADEAAVAAGLAPGLVRAAFDELARAGQAISVGDRWFAAATVERAAALALDAVERYHRERPAEPGLPLERARAAVPGREPALAEAALARLVERGLVELRAGVAARPGFRPTLDERGAVLRENVRRRLADAGIAPPDVKELSRELGTDALPILKFLAQEGAAVAVTPDLYFDPDALADARRRVEAFLRERGSATPADLKAVLDVSRKYLIPILEWLDRQGVTARTGEGRTLRAQRSPSR